MLVPKTYLCGETHRLILKCTAVRIANTQTFYLIVVIRRFTSKLECMDNRFHWKSINIAGRPWNFFEYYIALVGIYVSIFIRRYCPFLTYFSQKDSICTAKVLLPVIYNFSYHPPEYIFFSIGVLDVWWKTRSSCASFTRIISFITEVFATILEVWNQFRQIIQMGGQKFIRKNMLFKISR